MKIVSQSKKIVLTLLTFIFAFLVDWSGITVQASSDIHDFVERMYTVTLDGKQIRKD